MRSTARPLSSVLVLVVLAGCSVPASGSAGSDSDAEPVVPSDWTVVDDEPSGVTFALPSADTSPSEEHVPAPDGEEVTVRNYVAMEPGAEIDFNILDVPRGEYSLDAALQGVVSSLDGTVEHTDDIDVGGHEAMQAEVSFGTGSVALFQLIVTDRHVLQPLVAGEETDREELDRYFHQLVESVDAR